MADTQVGSGTEISAKVSLSRPGGAARHRRRTGDPDSPEGSAASSRFFALWYRIRSPREFGNKSAEHVLRGGVVGKVEVSSGGLPGPGCAFAHCPEGPVRAGSLFIRPLGSPAGITHARDQVRGRTPTHRALRCAASTPTPSLTRVFLKLFCIFLRAFPQLVRAVAGVGAFWTGGGSRSGNGFFCGF